MKAMEQQVWNFSRFYGMFNKMAYKGDRDELKRDLVSQVTKGRTESLREVTQWEYEQLCSLLAGRMPGTAAVAELKRLRSIALHQMQRMGVNTADWDRVNFLCRDQRITGKPFGHLSCEELEALTTKLRIIERKGGFRDPGDIGQHAKIVSFNR